MNNMFYGALDAGEYACQFAGQWQDEAGDVYGSREMLGMMSAADNENPLDQTNPSNYYLVTPGGDIGLTYDGGNSFYWVFRAVPAGMRAVNRQNVTAPQAQYPQAQQPSHGMSQGQGRRPGVGFSDVVNTEEFQEAVHKNKRMNKGCAIAFIVAPVLVLPITSYFTEDVPLSTGFLCGAVISFVILLVMLIIGLRTKMEKPWVGTVEHKHQKREHELHRGRVGYDRKGNEVGVFAVYNHIVIRKDNGRKHIIHERSTDLTAISYHYFQIGDRVRYLPGMGLSFPYEKEDKTKDGEVVCVFCRRKAPLTETHCPKCHKPLLV